MAESTAPARWESSLSSQFNFSGRSASIFPVSFTPFLILFISNRILSFISWVALLVKVTAKICLNAMGCSNASFR